MSVDCSQPLIYSVWILARWEKAMSVMLDWLQ